jgi:hypothetical protein
MTTRIKASASASASAMRRRIKRRSERASHKKNKNATLRSRKQRAKKTARVMRGGAPKPVEIFLCYKGEKLGLIHDLEQRIIDAQKITQGQIARSIAVFDISNLIGILFRRTVYDWNCVFRNDDKAAILKAIRGLVQDDTLEMVIPNTISFYDEYIYGLRLFLSSRKSRIPWSNNLVLMDQARHGYKDWRNRQTLTVNKIAPMTETPDWLDNENIHFLNLKKLPNYIEKSEAVAKNIQFFNNNVKPHNQSYIDKATNNFDEPNLLSSTAVDVIENVGELIEYSNRLLSYIKN